MKLEVGSQAAAQNVRQYQPAISARKIDSQWVMSVAVLLQPVICWFPITTLAIIQITIGNDACEARFCRGRVNSWTLFRLGRHDFILVATEMGVAPSMSRRNRDGVRGGCRRRSAKLRVIARMGLEPAPAGSQFLRATEAFCGRAGDRSGTPAQFSKGTPDAIMESGACTGRSAARAIQSLGVMMVMVVMRMMHHFL
jgi:hypothetical protein